jgi:uncharacterized protein YkwD
MQSKIKLLFLLFAIVFSGFTIDRPSLSAQSILHLVNQDRKEHGLPQLSLSPTLSLAALSKAEDMLSQNYFAHISPSGVKPWHWFKSLGYEYVYAGENLAAGFDDPGELENSWMSSSDHRANILSPHYEDLGLAIVEREDTTLIVQFFGSRANKVTLRE